MENTTIYIIPIEPKPVKIIHEELPCPICSEIRCNHAKLQVEDLILNVTCTNLNNCEKLK